MSGTASGAGTVGGLRPRRATLLVAVLLTALAAALLSRTWMTWTNPFVDGSKELRIPQRVAEGERLYADVVCHFGPVPNWLHAAAYRAAGCRLTTPLLVLVPLSGLVFLSLFLLARAAGGLAAAAWGTAWGISLALVAPHGGALVLPYAYAATHSLAFATLGLLLSLSPRRGPLAGAALCWALALASKQEYAVASMGASLLAHAAGAPLPRLVPRRVFAAVAGGLLGGLGLFAWALRGLPLASLSPEGPLLILSPPPEWRALFRVVAGLDDPLRSLRGLATSAVLVLLLLGLVEGAGRLEARLRRGAPAVRTAFAALLLGGVALLLLSPAGRELDRALPALLAVVPPAALLAAGVCALRTRAPDPATRARVALLAFAGLASARVFLHVTAGWVSTPYSAFATPALAAASAVAAFGTLGRRPHLLSLVFAALVALQVGRTWIQGEPERWTEVRTAAGTLRLPADRGAAVQAAVDFLAGSARPGDGLAAFPEGGFFNFVLGLPSPLRLEQLPPGGFDAEGERRIARRMREAGPRFVLVPNQPTPLFGPVAFGRDYGREIWSEVERSYRLRAQMGDAPLGEPVGSPRFFLRIYERAPRAP